MWEELNGIPFKLEQEIPRIVTAVSPKAIILSERNRKQKEKYCTISIVHYYMSKLNSKQLRGEQWLSGEVGIGQEDAVKGVTPFRG